MFEKLKGLLKRGLEAAKSVFPYWYPSKREVGDSRTDAERWADSGERITVTSHKNPAKPYVKEIQYDKENRTLSVWFAKGGCRYPGVQYQTAVNFYNAPSKGVFLHANLWSSPYDKI